jgi:tripartite-type tricarboxylate transporter receptor subunit TctC
VGELRARAVIPYLSKYIPGNPTIIMEFMPGGGGMKAGNYIFSRARPDGLTLGNIGRGLVSNAIMGLRGVEYDIDKFIYLGTPDSATHYVFLTRKEFGATSLEKLQATSGIRVSAHSVGHAIYVTGRLFVYLLGLKEPRFATGYSDPEMTVAMAQGEVDGRSQTTESIERLNPDWIHKRAVDFHAAIEIPRGHKVTHFHHLPDIDTFARSEKERKLLSLYRNMSLVGTPYILPPGTPKDRVEILAEALRKTHRDPNFLRDFKKIAGDDATPLTPEDQVKAIREIPRDPEVIELLKKLSGADPLPPR